MSMTREEVEKKIADCLKVANKALQEAAQLGKEHGVSFYWDGPAYGMGGYFDWNSSNCEYEGDEAGWQSSSSSC